MKIIGALVVILFALFSHAQQTQSAKLPEQLFNDLGKANAMDVVMMQGAGSSISIEGSNVRMFNQFFENKPAAKTNAAQAGMIMWLIDGREFLSGNFYLGDSTGYIVFNKDGKEYVNFINTQGNNFFKGQIKK